MKKTLFKNYGIGVGIRNPHLNEFTDLAPKTIEWGEVISENYIDWESGLKPKNTQSLIQIRKNIPLALHGVSMNIGSADALDMNYLKRLKNLAREIEPIWISDHLCWTGVDGETTHDLLPVPFTKENLKFLTDKILKIQETLGQRILIENVSSYFEFTNSEMSEWQFIKELISNADCGLLLDLNNIYVSSINHDFDPLEFLKNIPPERVGQIHLAGHTIKNGYLIDTHDQPVCEEVWDLFRWTEQNLGSFTAMIERDGNIPAWTELEQEILKAHKIRKEVAFDSTQKTTVTI
jgi:uncharacterized protein (UPF0276 family)